MVCTGLIVETIVELTLEGACGVGQVGYLWESMAGREKNHSNALTGECVWLL